MIGLMIDDMRKYTVCILDNNDQLGQGGFCGENGNCSIEGHSIRVPNKLDEGSNGWKSFVYKPPECKSLFCCCHSSRGAAVSFFSVCQRMHSH